MKRWIGYDVPAAPSDAVFTGTADNRTVSWNAVTEGQHRGNIDVGNLTYSIVRMPDNTVVAEGVKTTSVTDDETLTELDAYSYIVTARVGDTASEGAATPALVLGPPLQAPFSSDFNEERQRAMYVPEDANGDGALWIEYFDSENYVFRYRYSELGESGDDWLFTPPLYMEKGKIYPFSFNVSNVNYPERMEVKTGLEASAEAMKYEIAGEFEITGAETHTAFFAPAASGAYNIGFHAMSDPFEFYLFLEGWSVGAGVDLRAPGKPTDLIAIPGEKGEMSAEIKFIVPSVNCSTVAVDAIEKVVVKRTASDEVLADIDNPKPGALVTVKDNSPAEGMNEYTIVASNSFGEGLSASVTTWVGPDVPSVLTDFDWEITAEGDGLLSWGKIGSKGANGGYVNPQDVTVTLYTTYPDLDILESGVKGQSFIDSSLRQIGSGQSVLYYVARARNTVGRSPDAMSHVGPFGQAYYLPFHESFAYGLISKGPWSMQNYSTTISEAQWVITDYTDFSDVKAQDGDAGMLAIGAYGYHEGTLVSPLISLKDVERPLLTFYASRPDDSTILTVRVSVDNGASWTDVGSVGLTNGTEWQKYEVSLAEWAGKDVCIGFYGKVPAGALECGVDNITVAADLSGVDNVLGETRTLQVSTSDGKLRVSGVNGKVSVYTIDGRTAAVLTVPGEDCVALPKGIYIVRSTDGQSMTVAM